MLEYEVFTKLKWESEWISFVPFSFFFMRNPPHPIWCWKIYIYLKIPSNHLRPKARWKCKLQAINKKINTLIHIANGCSISAMSYWPAVFNPPTIFAPTFYIRFSEVFHNFFSTLQAKLLLLLLVASTTLTAYCYHQLPLTFAIFTSAPATEAQSVHQALRASPWWPLSTEQVIST